MPRKPIDQGDLDGFCGMYSIINALTLLFPAAMHQEQRDAVFKAMSKALRLNGWPAYIWDGTSDRDVRQMLHGARSFLGGNGKPLKFDWEQPFAKTEFTHFEDFRRELKCRIEGDDAFAIVGLLKPWEHWTCAHRLTEHEMIMTDSCHVKQIPLAKCGLAGDGTDYELDHKQTFTLTRAKK